MALNEPNRKETLQVPSFNRQRMRSTKPIKNPQKETDYLRIIFISFLASVALSAGTSTAFSIKTKYSQIRGECAPRIVNFFNNISIENFLIL